MLEYLLDMEVTARWDGRYRCSVQARQFELTVDEPARHGGTDTGMQPTEVLLASVASCFTLAVAHVAMKRGLAVDGFTVTAQGEHRGPRFRRIVVRVDHAEPTPELVDVVRRAVSACYVSNTLRGGPEIEYQVGEVPIHRTPASPGGAAAPPPS
jgi:uncharacterized OsmC-like protein